MKKLILNSKNTSKKIHLKTQQKFKKLKLQTNKLSLKTIPTKRLKLKTNRLVLKSLSTTKRLKLKVPERLFFKEKEDIIDVLRKCKSYYTNTLPLELNSQTQWPTSEKKLQAFIDYVQFEDPRIENITFNTNNVVFQFASTCLPGNSMWMIFSNTPLIYERKSKTR